MGKTFLMLAFLAPLACAPAFAAGQMKPGLWEMTMKSDAMKNMPKIPPEQMEQMKKMGIAVPEFQDGGMKTRICITKEMADREEPPVMDPSTGCQPRNYQRSGNSYSMDIVCNGADMKGEGKAKGSFSGSDNFTSTYDFKGTMHGQPVNQHHESSGKWLAADCGNVKSYGDMKPKK
ncbi:DUF3617 domain-containing protein [Noviherbaspirillum galbum]|uniref:DUF3617 domain-containing protein n=1 Tax=Noviherbaspirillum galbum TaxID=2709383 RepID=A0A6B3SN82_9BURK|nr:DUF3617 domain-containing protein [Noviherbaspirillum galbum]NEX60745.1 DUF3617 domain-containing protein [Noviherbaspirillum galbum]